MEAWRNRIRAKQREELAKPTKLLPPPILKHRQHIVNEYKKSVSEWRNTLICEPDAETDLLKQKIMDILKIYNPKILENVHALFQKHSGKEKELYDSIYSKYITKSSAAIPIFSNNPGTMQVFLEFAIDDEIIGVCNFFLYDTKTPLAAENFRSLCCGDNNKVIHYLAIKLLLTYIMLVLL